jgi:hypothetical protein
MRGWNYRAHTFSKFFPVHLPLLWLPNVARREGMICLAAITIATICPALEDMRSEQDIKGQPHENINILRPLNRPNTIRRHSVSLF